MANEVAVRGEHRLATLEEMKQMANAIAQSGLFGIKEPVQALALMLLAQAENLHPATVAQDYNIINGQAARKTNSVLARFQQAGGRIKWLDLTDTCARAVFSHAQGGDVTIDWDIERAKRTMIWNKKKEGFESLAERMMYRSYPRAMLRARCIAEGVRAVYPAAIGGMLVVEEAEDTEAIDMGPAEVVEQPKAKPKTAAAQQETHESGSADGKGSAAVAPQTQGGSEPIGSHKPEVAGSTPAPATASAPQEDSRRELSAAESATPQSPTAAEPIEGDLLSKLAPPTLADCLKILDGAAEAKMLEAGIQQVAEFRRYLSPEDQANLDSTVDALREDAKGEQKADGPKFTAGQRRILLARMKANKKSEEEFAKQFGPLDQVLAVKWEECQSWVSA